MPTDAPVATPPAAPPAAAPPATPPPAAPAPAAAPPAAAPPAAASTPPAKSFDAELEAKFAAAGTKLAPETPKPEPTKPAAPAKPEPPKPGQQQRPAEQLRAELERWKTEASTKAAALAANEAKIKELEAKGRDVEALTARSTQLEQELAQAKAEVRRARKEIDPEFRKPFQKEFDQVNFTTEQIISRMDVADPVTGEMRQGRKEDVDYLWKIESPTKRNAEIRKMFGDDAITIIPKIDRMVEIQTSYQHALAEQQAQAAELEKQEAGKQVQAKTQLQQAYQQVSKELAESVDEYHDAPDDKEAAEMRQRGFQIFDQQVQDPNQNVIKHAHIRQMVAAHFPLKLKISRLQAEVKTLKAELDAMKEATPGPTKRTTGGGAAPSGDGLSWEEAARKELA